MTERSKIPPERRRELQAHPRRGRPGTRRSELERLLDLTVLGPTHPEPGTCWRFTGTTTPYGRMAKAQDSYTHRLGWKLLRGPIPEDKELHHRCGIYACWNPDHLELATHLEAVTRPDRRRHGAASPLRRLRLLESGPSPDGHPRRELGLRAQDVLQARAPDSGCEPPDRPADGRADLPGVCRGTPASVSGAPGCS